ncbi:Histone-lysine N-methyltransferase trr [Pelomyxa schiedti]|nr:Histone-lysine N-methyltransferase trr [Pelomyxa schiedti]
MSKKAVPEWLLSTSPASTPTPTPPRPSLPAWLTSKSPPAPAATPPPSPQAAPVVSPPPSSPSPLAAPRAPAPPPLPPPPLPPPASPSPPVSRSGNVAPPQSGAQSAPQSPPQPRPPWLTASPAPAPACPAVSRYDWPRGGGATGAPPQQILYQSPGALPGRGPAAALAFHPGSPVQSQIQITMPATARQDVGGYSQQYSMQNYQSHNIENAAEPTVGPALRNQYQHFNQSYQGQSSSFPVTAGTTFFYQPPPLESSYGAPQSSNSQCRTENSVHTSTNMYIPPPPVERDSHVDFGGATSNSVLPPSQVPTMLTGYSYHRDDHPTHAWSSVDMPKKLPPTTARNSFCNATPEHRSSPNSPQDYIVSYTVSNFGPDAHQYISHHNQYNLLASITITSPNKPEQQLPILSESSPASHFTPKMRMVTLTDLIQSGLIAPGEQVSFVYLGKGHPGVITAKGAIESDGKLYLTPTAWSMAIRKNSHSGWPAVRTSAGTRLSDLKAKFLATNCGESHQAPRKRIRKRSARKTIEKHTTDIRTIDTHAAEQHTIEARVAELAELHVIKTPTAEPQAIKENTTEENTAEKLLTEVIPEVDNKLAPPHNSTRVHHPHKRRSLTQSHPNETTPSSPPSELVPPSPDSREEYATSSDSEYLSSSTESSLSESKLESDDSEGTVYDYTSSEPDEEEEMLSEESRSEKDNGEVDISKLKLCSLCGITIRYQEALACVQCGELYHFFCLHFTQIPPNYIHSSWRCISCRPCASPQCENPNDEHYVACSDCGLLFHGECGLRELNSISSKVGSRDLQTKRICCNCFEQLSPKEMPDNGDSINSCSCLEATDTSDLRVCALCLAHESPQEFGWLLPVGTDVWVHSECVRMSPLVTLTSSGMQGVFPAISYARMKLCFVCWKEGASITCSMKGCWRHYHLNCAIKAGNLMDLSERAMYCKYHDVKALKNKDSAIMLDLAYRSSLHILDENLCLPTLNQVPVRIGTSITVLELGKNEPPHIGYKCVKSFWPCDGERANTQLCYECEIVDTAPSLKGPLYKIKIGEDTHVLHSAVEARQYILTKANLQVETAVVSSLDHCGQFFGFSHPWIVAARQKGEEIHNSNSCARILPYTRKSALHAHSRAQAVIPGNLTTTASNTIVGYLPTGRRTETTLSQYTFHSNGTLNVTNIPAKSFKKKLQATNPYLSVKKSLIQGWGVFTSTSIDPGTILLEYVGELIRPNIAEIREARYRRKGIGDYMFKLDDNTIVDATMKGGKARFANHSCNPNAFTQIITVEGKKKIVLISKQTIREGEEVVYDYKFPIEEGTKVPCHCGARNCVGHMN